MMRNRWMVALWLASASAGASPATEPAAAPPAEQRATPAQAAPLADSAAARWLELQAGGTQAGRPSPAPAEVDARVYKRYVESFDRPLPDNFIRER